MPERVGRLGGIAKGSLVAFGLAYLAIQGLCGWVVYIAIVAGAYWVAVLFGMFCITGMVAPILGLLEKDDAE